MKITNRNEVGTYDIDFTTPQDYDESDWTNILVAYLNSFKDNHPLGRISTIKILDGFSFKIHHINEAAGGSYFCSVHNDTTQDMIYAKVINPFYMPPEPISDLMPWEFDL